MTPGMKMMMMERARQSGDPGMNGRHGMENQRNRRFEYEETKSAYEPENRGRRRYQNGRFAPRNDGTFMEMENRHDGPENRYSAPENRYNGPRYTDGGYRMNEDGGRMAGFEGGYDGGRMDYDRRMNFQAIHQSPAAAESFAIGSLTSPALRATSPQGEVWGSPKTDRMGHGESHGQEQKHLDQHTAKKWVEAMGESFSMEETMEALKKRKCRCEPLEFWVIVNAMKSDYPKLAAKYGVDHIDFYADMAVEWLEDRDAKPGKAMNYYRNVVRHE